MICLGIQTAAQPYSIALVDKNRVLTELIITANYEFTESLMETIDSLCKKSDIIIQDISCVGVITGPGGYTGLRSGIVTAKTIASVLKKPIYGIPTMEALAETMPPIQTVLLCAIKATKKDYNIQMFQRTIEKKEAISECKVVSIERLNELLSQFKKTVYMTGIFDQDLVSSIQNPNVYFHPSSIFAHTCARLAEEKYESKEDSHYPFLRAHYSHSPV
jgi:tRNA threonylcarbamoyladenosine biosynthesis protein TsaB